MEVFLDLDITTQINYHCSCYHCLTSPDFHLAVCLSKRCLTVKNEMTQCLASSSDRQALGLETARCSLELQVVSGSDSPELVY